MNNRMAIGIVGGLIIVALFFAYATFTRTSTDTPSPVSTVSTSTETTTDTKQPSTAQAKENISVSVGKVALFDAIDTTVSTNSPVITGVANVPKVDVIIINSEGVGLAAGRDIPVEGGRWSYSPPLLLQPGVYTVQLLGGDKATQTTLTVRY